MSTPEDQELTVKINVTSPNSPPLDSDLISPHVNTTDSPQHNNANISSSTSSVDTCDPDRIVPTEFRAELAEHLNTTDPDSPHYWLKATLQNRYLNESQIKSLCDKVALIMLKESNVVCLNSPVTVVGDIHGQFYDLRKLFEVSKFSLGTKYVFLGDYVDRGYYSVETLTLLLVLKVLYPERITLIRGNHETRMVSTNYGFYDECLKKYDNVGVWHMFCRIFDLMPISALIDDEILCIHGGISPYVPYIDCIHDIDRNMEVPNASPFSHLIWSDPEERMLEKWALNPRGAGVLFNGIAHKEFCENNGIRLVCRAHQLINEGIKYIYDKSLVTVWSAPNYCYRCSNLASVLEINNGEENPIIFDAVPDLERKVPERIVTPYFL